MDYILNEKYKKKKIFQKISKKAENKGNSKNSKNEMNKIFYCPKLFFYKNAKLLNHRISLPTIIILLIIFFSSSFEKVQIRQLISSNEIILKISGTGYQNIISYNYEDTNTYQVYVNDMDNPISITDLQKTISVESEPNIIKIVWTTQLENCQNMFAGLDNILEADLSNFDSSQVTNMESMFHSCTSLTSIKISNLDTSSLNYMNSIFYNCSQLTELDLSNWVISNVKSLRQAFFECRQLISLDISNFDTSSVTDMYQMFLSCNELISLDLSHFDTKSVENMFQMFCSCNKLEYLDVSNFNTSSVTDMSQMFLACSSLQSLDISSFTTQSLNSMTQMFTYCSRLKSLDLSNFDTSGITDMHSMFQGDGELEYLNLNGFKTSSCTNLENMFDGCYSLKSLDLSHFDTSNVINMNNLFSNCNQLETVDISNFDTSSVQNMAYMFHNCNSLKSLDLSKFDTSQVVSMEYMFSNCYSLTSLNINSFNTENVENYDNMFSSINGNLKYCFNNDINNEIKSQLPDYNKVECSELCQIDSNQKYIPEQNKCIEDCSNDDTYIYEYNNECYSSCPYDSYMINNGYLCFDADNIPLGYYISDNANKIIDKCDIKCNSCTLESSNNHLCTSCNTGNNYYPKSVENANSGKECYTGEQIGYYLDTINQIYNLCHETCKKCSGPENNQCTECNINYNLIIGKCKENETNKTTYFYDLNSNSNELKDKYTNVTFIDVSQEFIDFIYSHFNLDKQKDKIYITIDDSKSEEENKATSEYDYRIFLENGTELNLSSIEEDVYVDIYVPIKDLDMAKFDNAVFFSEQGYDIYDKNSEFYNDFCTSANQAGNDITLKDRKKDIYPNNITLCEDNCEYNGIDIENQRIICSCNLNTNKNYTEEEDDFLAEDNDGNFITYLLDKVNYKIFTCFSLIKSLDNLIRNYAFYTFVGIFTTTIILNLVFIFHTLPSIKKMMFKEMPTKSKIRKEIIKELKRLKNLRTVDQVTNVKNPNKKKKKASGLSLKRSKKTKNKNASKFKVIQNLATKPDYVPSEEKIITFPKEEDEDNKEELKKDEIDENEEKEEKMDINELPYSLAKIKDKRNIVKIFFSIIIQKIELLNIFCGNELMRSMLICEYILSLLINFFINTLLYSDDVVSNKYHNNGQLDFIVTIVLSLLSNVISSIICYFVKYSEGINEKTELILEIKSQKDYFRNLLIFFKFLKLKFICFIISELIIICCCFYYIIIFCIVYSQSRGSLMINYLSSLVEGLITSIAISIIIMVLRKIALVCSSKIMYNITKYVNNKF